MNASLRTLPLPGAVRPVREHGASALDRIEPAWPAPDPTTIVIDPALSLTGLSPWPAPDPVMRFDLPAPDLSVPAPVGRRIPWTDLVEPRYAVPVPDLHSASRDAIAAPAAERASSLQANIAPAWPPPTLADAAPLVTSMPARRRTSGRWAIGVAAAVGAAAAGAVALVALL